MRKNLFTEITRRMSGYPLQQGSRKLDDLMIPVCLSTVGGMFRIYLTGLDPLAMIAS